MIKRQVDLRQRQAGQAQVELDVGQCLQFDRKELAGNDLAIVTYQDRIGETEA